MRLNENTVLFGDRVILVPYRAEHVPTYHEWMKSSELLELTASEPLSYEEELDMQRKWHIDEDKLTFILLERPSSLPPTAEQNQKVILPPSCLARCRMVGDVNLFLPEGLEGDGECEIMIASKDDRRKRFAIEALSLLIGASNLPSIHLFRKLGFGVVKHVQVFDEMELRWGAKDVECLSLEGLDEVTTVDWRETSLQGRIGVYDA
ncbi:hypothetical protein CNBI3150 [Cryptococcus deneoformans B-3501A]|uniref:hypothetical protein n=1 Tax=Cryptococcus deneoformans (strain B-3501A) TaxID=283643 RepID=UPI000042EC6D|nr:hypothetical protein CNBI3150 [Cryptococcus neoformans var. neoformans B-3501A]EAL18729.1 hypothetical protein CNBI3150 [Cryptococcus neoformans var. neoformans B-3501A]